MTDMLVQEAMQVLDGLMLGDGHLKRFPNTALYTMGQSKSSVPISYHLKYGYWLRDNAFAALGIKVTVKPTDAISKGRAYTYANLWTQSSSLLASVYDEYYFGGEWVKRNKSSAEMHHAAKRIPERLMLADKIPTLTLAHWFLGDGESSWANIDYYTPSIHAGFSTHCFSEVEVERLRVILGNMDIKTDKIGIRQYQKHGWGARILISQYSIDHFMNIIEQPIMNIFGDSIGPSYKDMVKYKNKDCFFNMMKSKIGR